MLLLEQEHLHTEEYVSGKVQMWLEEIRTSSNIAQSHLHIAYSTLTTVLNINEIM